MGKSSSLTKNTFQDHDDTRLDELERYRIIDTPAEKEFDDVAEIAAHVAGTKMAYISFLDRTTLWFKSTYGFQATKVPRRQTYCHFVVADQKPIVIPDTMEETVYVPSARDEIGSQIRFYVGVPIRAKSGAVLGTLCAVDTMPRSPAEQLVSLLEKLARQVSGQLEVRRVNRMLLEERDTFSTLFEAAPAPLLLAENGVIIRCNYAFAALVTDEDTDSLAGLRLGRFVRDVPERAGSVIETNLTNTFGGSTPVLVTLTRVHRDQRTYDLVALTDISDRKEKERILKEQQTAAENAARIKDTFLSLVSHDLRSPLSGISTMLELLDRAGETFSPDEWKSAIHDLRESAAVLVEMINQLLNIHRLQSGRISVQREEVAVAMIARQVTLSLGKQIKDKDIAVAIDVDDDRTLLADIGLFREALFNLVSNAVKFSYRGGTIRVRVSHNAVIVEDTGDGVAKEDRADLFRHEVKTSRIGTEGERGTGLGLPLVADIMEAHGGRIYYDDSYTEGARFVLVFEETDTAPAESALSTP